MNTDHDKQFAWKLTNGAFVHPQCREPYQREREIKNRRPSIESAIYPGYAMSPNTRCDHCLNPIWAAPKKGGQ
jgi:hypothetical protein